MKRESKLKYVIKIYRGMRNVYVKCRYYHLRSERDALKHVVIMFIDERSLMCHPGLADRFKSIIGMYYISTMNKFKFKLIFNIPFKLEKYLLPNKVNWVLEKGDIDYGMFTTKLIMYDGFEDMPLLNDEINQYHCCFYTGHNYLQYHQVENWEERWRVMFHNLFRPSEYLEELLERELPKETYAAVHLRFVNALGEFEKGYKSRLTHREQLQLVDKCFEMIDVIVQKENNPLYIISDNEYFMRLAQKRGYMILGTGHIRHISFGSDSESHDKTFVDFFALSNAQKIYAIHGEALYNSVFPYYAAIIGAVPYMVENI